MIEHSPLEEQCGFRPQTGTIDQIRVLLQVIEKAIRHRSNLHICSVDLCKEFDSVPRHALTNILKDSGIEVEVIRLLTCTMVQAALYKIGRISSKLEVTTGVHQGSVLSPILFNLFMNRIMSGYQQSN